MTPLLTILMAVFLLFLFVHSCLFLLIVTLVFLPLNHVINKPHLCHFFVYKGSLKHEKIDPLCLFRNIERPSLIVSLLFPQGRVDVWIPCCCKNSIALVRLKKLLYIWSGFTFTSPFTSSQEWNIPLLEPLLVPIFNCTFAFSTYFSGNCCMHDPTSNADLLIVLK